MTTVSTIALWLRRAAMAALAVMMMTSVIDITLRLSLNQLLLGSVEIVQWTIVAVVFLALPETILRHEQVEVDVLEHWVSARTATRIRRIGALLTLVLLTLMLGFMLPQAADTLVIGDLTTDLQVSLFWFWMPLLLGTAGAVLSALVCLIQEWQA